MSKHDLVICGALIFRETLATVSAAERTMLYQKLHTAFSGQPQLSVEHKIVTVSLHQISYSMLGSNLGMFE